MRLEFFDEQQEFVPDFEAFCTQNCIQQLLHYYKVDNHYKYMDTSLDIMLYRLYKDVEDYDIAFRETFLIDDYENKIKKHEPDTQDPYKVWLENKKKIEEGIPIIVSVDMYDLEYSATKGIYHSNHSVILTGFEEDESKVSLVDIYQWKFKGDVSMEQYLKARSSLCPNDESPFSGFPILNRWYEVEATDWKGNEEELLKRTLDLTLLNYYENPQNDNINHFYGTAALHKTYDILKNSREMNEEFRTELLKKIRKVVLRLYAKLNLLRYYIAQSIKVLENNEMSELVEALNADLRQWKKYLYVIVKGIYNTDLELYDKITEKFYEMVLMEDARYDLLIKKSRML
jgi:hypothetical protein